MMNNIAYLYIRWSSAKQESGDSLRRQREYAAKYASQNKLNIVELPIDDGVSAWKGNNLTSGQLGKFIDDVESGIVETPTIMLTEQLDRLSRVDVWAAPDILRRLVAAGVSVITTKDNKIYDKTNINDIAYVISAIVESDLSAKESAKKSERIKSAWDAKKKRALEHGEAMTNMNPFWLKKVGKKFELNNQHIPTIQKMFELYLEGYGTNAIANYLNENKYDTPLTARKVKAKVWYGESIRKLLLNKALIGHYHNKVDYYPVAIDPELFAKVQATKGAIKKQKGGGNNHDNILARLCKCAKCGDSMYRRKSNGKDEYRCRTGINDKTKCNAARWKSEQINEIVLNAVKEINVEELFTDNNNTLVKKLKDKIILLQHELDTNAKKYNRISKAIELSDDDIDDLLERRIELKQESKDIAAQLKDSQKELESANSYATVFATAQANVHTFYNNATPENILKLNLELRKIIDVILLDNTNHILSIQYKNGVCKEYYSEKDLDDGSTALGILVSTK